MTNPTPLSTLLGELDALVEAANGPDSSAWDVAANALLRAYPQLREGIEQLQREKDTDAVRERDEARAERNARARDVMHLEAENERLRALVAQQQEEIERLERENKRLREELSAAVSGATPHEEHEETQG